MSPAWPTIHLARAAGFALVLAAGAGDAAAAAQLFKCMIDKRTVYQQQACPANADPAAASAPAAAAASSTAREAASAPRRLKPASPAAASDPATRQ